MFLMLTGCAGFWRGCSSWSAQAFGSDWIVVQYNNQGQVFKCWRLGNTSIANEQSSDGIYWKSPDGHLVHISGWYNRVQVYNANWTGAAKQLGLDESVCN
jgi:hypothetical protein